MTKTDWFVLIIVVLFATTIIGSQLGFSINGEPITDIQANADNLTDENPISFAADSMEFLFGMIFFSIDGMPAIVSAIFDIFCLIAIFLLILIIRGN